MQPSARQQELERLYNSRSRKGHVPHISISDDDHHVTEAIGSYYDGEEASSPVKGEARPYSFMASPSEAMMNSATRNSRRNGSYFDMKSANQQRVPLGRSDSNEKVPSPTENGGGSASSMKRMSSLGSENSNGNGIDGVHGSPSSLNRQPSTETAAFPLNDIDYESSPAAVAQELSNLQAIRRMSMNVDTADPDLPSFGGVVPTVAPNRSEDENDTSRLFWVPARLHPELAPKEFKTFIEDRVDKIRRRSGDSDSLSVDGLERSGSGSSLRRKKSMLSRQVDPQGSYEDGAERLERKRSKRMPVEGQTQVDLSELESLVSDPSQLMRRMSLDAARRSLDSGVEVPASEDMPILPPTGQSLKRSTRTTYRRGSLKKGERVPFSKRAQLRQAESESEDSSGQTASAGALEEPVLGLTRVQTEPSPAPVRSARETFPSRTDSSLRWREQQALGQPNEETESQRELDEGRANRSSAPDTAEEDRQSQPQRPQQRQFHSRLASGPGRTTAQLPGYDNPNPLPHIIETLPDGTKAPVKELQQSTNTSERKSKEHHRPVQRGGAHMRPVPGREHQRSSTLDDLSSNPSPLPGSGNTRTDALTMVPTFDEKKADKKEGTRKSSWKSFFSSDDDDKERKAARKEELSDSGSVKSSKSKLLKTPTEKARLDVLQSSIEGNNSPRGRESLVLNREDLQLDAERKKESKKASEPKKEKEKDSGLLSAIFGGKKKTSDTDLKEKKRKSDRNLSPDPTPKIMKPDIDYNWTRFSILEERAIYRMAHIKLANPRRALYSQVLLSNFMYSYLAKVQMMHPQVQIPPAHQKSQQRGTKQSQQQQEEQPAEYSQYQRWQQQQERESQNAANAVNTTNNSSAAPSNNRTSLEIVSGGQPNQQQAQYPQQRTSYDYDEDSSAAYDTRSSEEYEYDHSYQTQQSSRANGIGTAVAGNPQSGYSGHDRGSSRGGGYSVAGTHDYLGYPKDQQPFDSQGGLWEDEEKQDLW